MGDGGMPGIGGSLGQCQVCGKNFVNEVLLGTRMVVVDLDGINESLAVHQKCCDEFDGRPWQELPEGPLRRVFEEAHESEGDDEQSV